MRITALAVVVLLVTACAGGTDTPEPPLTFERGAGDTEQGMRIRVERSGSTLAIEASADCGDVPSNIDAETIRAEVADSGEFEATHTAVHELDEGASALLTATVEGRLRGEVASGMLDVTVRYVDSRGVPLPNRRPCVTGPLAWEARSGTLDWPGIETIRVEGVGDVLSSDGHAFAVGPMHLQGAPVDVTTIDPAGRVVGQADLEIHDYALAEHSDALAIHDGQLWAPTRSGPFDGELGRHDLRTGEAVTMPAHIGALASDGADLWTVSIVAGDRPVHTLERRDLVTGEISARTTAGPGRLVLAGGRVWIVEEVFGAPTGRAIAYDPETLGVVDTIPLPDASIYQVAGSADALWLRSERSVLRVDVATGEILELPIQADDVAIWDEQAWIVRSRERTARRIDPDGTVTTYDLPVGGTSVAVSDPSTVWIGTLTDVVMKLVP